MKEHLKISIITVCYNSVMTLEKTIESVINQKYSNIEYIIIDGGSKDGTIDIIKKYETKITYWISEPDNGIYDAMNKGIDQATGELVYFVGSGDRLINDMVLNSIMEEYIIACYPDILCGRVRLICSENNLCKVIGKELNKTDILEGEMPPHQGMFTNLSLLKSRKFDISYDICADRDFFVWSFVNKKIIIYTNIMVADYDTTGFSSNSIKVFDQIEQVAKKYNPNGFTKYKTIKNKLIFKLIQALKFCKCLGMVRKNVLNWKKAS